jgi:hypothetical protein
MDNKKGIHEDTLDLFLCDHGHSMMRSPKSSTLKFFAHRFKANTLNVIELTGTKLKGLV